MSEEEILVITGTLPYVTSSHQNWVGVEVHRYRFPRPRATKEFKLPQLAIFLPHVNRPPTATHPEFRYQLIAEPEELGNSARGQWVSGRPGEAPAYAGTDFIIARDGRIAAIYLFFDKV
jgi:hypothetical protein